MRIVEGVEVEGADEVAGYVGISTVIHCQPGDAVKLWTAQWKRPAQFAGRRVGGKHAILTVAQAVEEQFPVAWIKIYAS